MNKKILNTLLITSIAAGFVSQGVAINANATENDEMEGAKTESRKAHGDIFPVKHSIMGGTDISKDAFRGFLLSQQSKYGFEYKLTCTLDQWLDYVYEEAAIEGVRPDIVVAQAIKETGYFKFGGTLTYKDNNFAGIGVTGASGAKESFATAREGVRAQVQHLKAYGSKDALVQACIDPRFNLVTRGSAPSLEELAGKWAFPGYSTSQYSSLEAAAAANDSYGQQIYKIMEQARAFEGTTIPGVPEKPQEPSSPESPQGPTIIAKGQVKNVSSQLNVRSGAGTNYKVVSSFKNGQAFNIYGKENGWYKVDYSVNGSTNYGYISGDYVKITEEFNKPSTPEVEKPSVPETGGNQGVTREGQVVGISSRLNVRSGAGTNYSVVTTITNGTKLKINSESNGWYNVTLSNGKSGYVSSQYVKLITNNPNDNNPENVIKKGTVKDVTTVLNVRSGPGTSYKSIAYLKNNETVEIIGESGSWYKIKSSKSNDAYVSKSYIKTN